MKKIILILIGLLLLPFLSSAQDKSIADDEFIMKAETKLSLYGGFNNGAIRDYNISPLIYKNFGPSFGFDYERLSANKKNLFLGNVIYIGGKGTTIASDSLTTEYIDGAISFAWLRKTTDLPKQGKLYVGGGYASSINFMQFNNVFESFSFTLSHGLSLNARGLWNFDEKQSLDVGLASPIFSLLVRPPFAGYNSELERNLERPLRLITNDGNWVSVNTFFMLNSRIRYQYHFNEKFSGTFAYNFMIQSLARVRHYGHQCTLGIIYKIGKNEK